MANEIWDKAVDFFQGDWGFITVIVLIIFLFWGFKQWKKRRKKKMEVKKTILPSEPPEPSIQQTSSQVEWPKNNLPKTDEPLFDLGDEKTLHGVEKDASKILKQRTESIEEGLLSEKQMVVNKLRELEETEAEIKAIVLELKENYQQVKRQQKIYHLIKKSLEVGQDERN